MINSWFTLLLKWHTNSLVLLSCPIYNSSGLIKSLSSLARTLYTYFMVAVCRTFSVLQFMPAASLCSTSSPASSTSSGESSENIPTEGPVNRNWCSTWLDAETRFLLEIWRDKLWRESVQENSLKMLRLPSFFQKLRAFAMWTFRVKGLNFTVKTDVMQV